MLKNNLIQKIMLTSAILFLVFSLIDNAIVVSAETSESPNIIFSLEYPSNQDPNIKGYFKLAMQQDQQQTVYIKLTNNEDKPALVNIIKTNALTAQNGGIHYTEAEGSELSYILDKNFLLNRYTEVQGNIQLPANSSQTIAINLHAPKTGGTYLGGILFTTKKDEEKESKDKIQIKNEVRVGTAIQLDIGERHAPVIDIKESIVQIYPAGIQIQTRIENATPSLIKSYALHYKVYDDQNKLMFEGGSEQFDMAPKSGIMFPANWNNATIKEGKYRIEFEIKGEGKTYTKKNAFEVKKPDIVKYENITPQGNNNPVVEKDNNILIYSLVGVIFALVIYIIFITKRRKQDEKESEHHQ
jgi:hypothetical protein